jgi:large subunit ribosomal protein L35
MPKQKTHSGAKKRFRVTKQGKVIHQRMGMNHILEKKSSSRKRRLRQEAALSGGDAKKIKRLLVSR